MGNPQIQTMSAIINRNCAVNETTNSYDAVNGIINRNHTGICQYNTG